MTRYLLDISRAAGQGEAEYRQAFAFETDDPSATVATALRAFDAEPNLRDASGEPATAPRWECNCLQKKCGACAMLVNGKPALACDSFLAAASQKGKHPIRLDPLRKFPRIADLVVNRSAIFSRLRELEAWHTEVADLPIKRSSDAYEASRCLQCGCCLEVCPNFAPAEAFGGMAAMVPLARLIAEAQPEERERLAQSYREHVQAGCGKSLACRNICPAGIDLAHLMSRSNAATLWRRW